MLHSRRIALAIAMTAALSLAGPGGSFAGPDETPPAVFDPADSDQKAVEIADQVLEALGVSAWKKVRYLTFRYQAVSGDQRLEERTYYWDCEADMTRMEGPSASGKPVVVVVDLETGEGKAAVDGAPREDETGIKLLDAARSKFNEDIIWVTAPFRLKEPGARLRYEGEKVAGPVTYDMITAIFAINAETKYRYYVNRETKMIDILAFVFKGRNVTPVAFNWTEWTDIDGVKFSLRKSQPGVDIERVLDQVHLYQALPETVFTSTESVDPAVMATGQ